LIGVLGALTEATGRRLVAEIKPVLDDLRDEAGFRLSQALDARVLRDSGE
jgi:predicted nucleic acid-binding protein